MRAIDRSLTVGPHGLPLMGSGDWNDGMNAVGKEGRGESVLLGWFLLGILRAFAPLCEARGDGVRAARYRAESARLADMLELAWDGEWYRRAYFDDGTPLGSKQNEQCRIDSMAQSWAVLSGGAPTRRAEQAMDAVRAHLVQRARADDPAARPALRRGAARSRLHRGLSAGACARTAASTPTPRSGWRWRSRASAAATRPSSCSTC